MALSAILDSIEDLDPQVAEHYTENEKDGKFYLNVTSVGGLSLEDVKGLRGAIEQERHRVNELRGKLNRFDGLEDPDAARDALERLANLDGWEDGKKKAEEMMAAFKEQLEKKHAKEITDRDQRYDKVRTQLEDELITAAAVKELARHKGNATLLLPHVKARTKLQELQDGGFVAYVVGDDGQERVSTEPGSVGKMTIAELVSEMKDDSEFSAAFEPDGPTGGGARNNTVERPSSSRSRTVTPNGGTVTDVDIEDLASGKVSIDGY